MLRGLSRFSQGETQYVDLGEHAGRRLRGRVERRALRLGASGGRGVYIEAVRARPTAIEVSQAGSPPLIVRIRLAPEPWAQATGRLAPLATLVLVLVTLFAAVPVYYRVAARSPHGQGSIAMLERLLHGWGGKLLVLVLLGFAATDFIITITLSAADAAEHLIHNPLWVRIPEWLHGQVTLTFGLLFVLGAIFLRGFREVIGVAVVIPLRIS